MKRFIYYVTVAAAFAACCAGCTKRTVAKPDWFTNAAYFEEKNGMYAEMPVFPKNIVMVGDDYIDRGLWNEFYGDTTIKNRGITYDASAHVLYRIDGIAARKPAKIFVSAGINDVLHGTPQEETVENVRQIFRRIAKASPQTKRYYLNVVCWPSLDEAQAQAAAALNEALRKVAADNRFEYIDVNAALKDGLADGTFSWDGGKLLNGAGYQAYAKAIEQQVGKPALLNPDDRDYPLEVSDYYRHRVSLFRALPETKRAVVMLGNSLNNNALWTELFPFGYVVNRGISGDVIDGVCQRVDELVADNPDKVFVMTGCNDLVNDPEVSAMTVYDRYENLIRTIREQLPETELYVQSILPMSPKSKYYEGFNTKVAEINKLLAGGTGRYGYYFIDVAKPLSNAEGDLLDECTTDGIHLSAYGYFLWAGELVKGNRMMQSIKPDSDHYFEFN